MNNSNISLISIIIPTYNYSHTLERSVSSVCKQMDKYCELLVINDGSTDNTLLLLEDLKTRYNNIIKIVNKPNGGAGSARNKGASIARGDYFIFLDADDELSPDAITNIRNHLKLNPNTHFVIGGHNSVHANGQKKLHKASHLPDDLYTRLKAYLLDKTISLSNGACVMHRSIFQHYQYPEHFRNSEDIPMFAYCLVNFSCSTIDFPLANVYKHHDSLRHNVKNAIDVGLDLVEEVFNLKRIPPNLQYLKKDFLVQRLLSLSRVCHEANENFLCKEYFYEALRIDMTVIFKLSYLKKYLKSILIDLVKK